MGTHTVSYVTGVSDCTTVEMLDAGFADGDSALSKLAIRPHLD
jgi:hypothetical protein